MKKLNKNKTIALLSAVLILGTSMACEPITKDVSNVPVTCRWGTSKCKDEAIFAESSDGVCFSVYMNCTAKVNEYNEDYYLETYEDYSLSTVMDSDIKAMVECEFARICGDYTMEDILLFKGDIMEELTNNVSSYFEEYGIEITLLNIRGYIHYEDEMIRKTMSENFCNNINCGGNEK